jgi:hypothetical protein
VRRDFGVSRKAGYFGLEQQSSQIPRQPARHTGFTDVSGVRAKQEIWDLLAGHADDDEHHVYAIPL